MMYEPRLSASKNGFALKIHSLTPLGVLLRGIFWPLSWLGARRFMPWRIANLLAKPFTWNLLDGHERFSMPITPVDALHICWALDFDDKDMEFFWAMQVSIMWEEARDDGDDDIAMVLKGLLSTQGYNEMGERIHA